MNPVMQDAIKKAFIAALVAGVTVFFREYTREQERLDKEVEDALKRSPSW